MRQAPLAVHCRYGERLSTLSDAALRSNRPFSSFLRSVQVMPAKAWLDSKSGGQNADCQEHKTEKMCAQPAGLSAFEHVIFPTLAMPCIFGQIQKLTVKQSGEGQCSKMYSAPERRNATHADAPRAGAPVVNVRTRHATTMPVVVRPAPIWQLKMMGSSAPAALTARNTASHAASRGATPSVCETVPNRNAVRKLSGAAVAERKALAREQWLPMAPYFAGGVLHCHQPHVA